MLVVDLLRDILQLVRPKLERVEIAIRRVIERSGMRSAVIGAVCCSKSAKGESAVAIPTLYFALMSSIHPPEQRIPEGLRRLQVLLPFEIVVELDVGIARSQTYLSRSKVVTLALRNSSTKVDLPASERDLVGVQLAARPRTVS